MNNDPIPIKEGRKGRSVAARLDGEPGGSPAAEQSQKSLGVSSDAKEQFRVVINREANTQLEEAVAKVNKGLEGSAVTRTDIAIYVFTHLSKLLTDADYKALRALYFDEKKVLGAILKSEEDLPEELRRALREHYGIVEANKKRSARPAPSLSTEAPVDNPPAA